MSNATALLGAIEAAEAEALAGHEAGTCHLSEWSCSYCEVESGATLPPGRAPDAANGREHQYGELECDKLAYWDDDVEAES